MGEKSDDRGAKWVLHELWNIDNYVPPSNTYFYPMLLMQIVAADGEIAPAEKEWILGNAAAHGAHQLDEISSYDPASETLEELLRRVKAGKAEGTYKATRSLIFNAFKAAAADGQLHEKERAKIYELGTRIGVEKEVVEQIEQLYHQEAQFNAKKWALLQMPDCFK